MHKQPDINYLETIASSVGLFLLSATFLFFAFCV